MSGPPYSLQESLHEEDRVSTARGEQTLEILRYRGESLFGAVVLAKGKKYRPEAKEQPLARLRRNGMLELRCNPDVEISTDGDGEIFDSLTEKFGHGWAPAPAAPFTLRRGGVSYHVRERFSETLQIPPAKRQIDSASIHIAGVSTWFHFTIIAILSVIGSTIYDVNAARLAQEDLQRFVEIAMKDLKTEAKAEIEKT